MGNLNVFSKTVKDRKRRARGGCYGGTSGRGHKGYKARSGSVVKGFEGGQTPIYRRLPMRGFNSKKEVGFTVVSLKRILLLVDSNVFDIDLDVMIGKKIVKKSCVCVKLIGSDVDVNKVKKIRKISVGSASKSVADFLRNNGVELVLSSN